MPGRAVESFFGSGGIVRELDENPGGAGFGIGAVDFRVGIGRKRGPGFEVFRDFQAESALLRLEGEG